VGYARVIVPYDLVPRATQRFLERFPPSASTRRGTSPTTCAS